MLTNDVVIFEQPGPDMLYFSYSVYLIFSKWQQILVVNFCPKSAHLEELLCMKG